MHNCSPSTIQVSDSSCGQLNQSTIGLQDQNRLQFILGIVLCFVGVAILFAPEKPQQFASICEKYNSVDACQIW